MAPQEMVDLGSASARETAKAVRTGIVSAQEACEAAIARIEHFNGPVNAVVVRDFDRALAAARQIDTSRQPDDPRSLLGVPMTVKESNDVAGLPTTWGMEAFRDLPVEADAVVVQRLKAAGAVILGKTNAPVALADWQTENPVYGRTLNPYDPGRSPGGSSGGAAVALATGMVPLEIGSDIGGSIRVPSHMCGVFGHKPTYGIVPTKGHGFPGTDGVDVPLAVVGPMARNAGDLVTAMDVIAGPEDGIGYRLDLPPPRHGALKDFRVLVLDALPGVAADADTRAAVSNLADSLSEAGALVSDDVSILPRLDTMHSSYVKMLNTVITRGTPGAEPMDAHAWMELVDEQMRIIRAWRAVFDQYDVVIAPVFSTPAFPYQTDPNWAKRTLMVDGVPQPYGAQLAWAGLATFPGLPATCVPVAKSSGSLPIGLQLIGAPFGDWTTLALAQLMESSGLTR
ncbi:amidase family protein [Hyphomonas sp.]|uniref:amidase family protein n=1 Tax=Hyphomonas sp. TaxID=87 RepID=UPI0032EC57B1